MENNLHHEILEVLNEEMRKFSNSRDWSNLTFEEFKDELKEWRVCELEEMIENIYNKYLPLINQEDEVDISQINHTQSDEEFEEEVRDYIFKRYECEC